LDQQNILYLFYKIQHNLKIFESVWNRTGHVAVSNRGYRFGRIGFLCRWILWCFDGPDHPVTLRLSDLFWTLGFRSNEREQIWGRLTVRVRVPTAGGELAAQRWSLPAFWGFPVTEEKRTGSRKSLHARMQGRRGQALPVERVRRGRSGSGDGDLRE
jgi:hypothetical protein